MPFVTNQLPLTNFIDTHERETHPSVPPPGQSIRASRHSVERQGSLYGLQEEFLGQ